MINQTQQKFYGLSKLSAQVQNNVLETSLTKDNILFQNLGATDLSEIEIQSKALELMYTELYMTINRTNQLSLVNFLN